MSKQTSIEWLIEQVSAKEPSGQYMIDTLTDKEVETIFDQAMQMHKREVVDAFYSGDFMHHHKQDLDKDGFEYYKETYGGSK